MSTATKAGNYYRVPNDLMRVYGSQIGPIGIAVYNALAVHADAKTGIAYPSVLTIAKMLGGKEKTRAVQYALKGLKAIDLVRPIGVKERGVVIYQLVAPMYGSGTPTPANSAVEEAATTALFAPVKDTRYALDAGEPVHHMHPNNTHRNKTAVRANKTQLNNTASRQQDRLPLLQMKRERERDSFASYGDDEDYRERASTPLAEEGDEWDNFYFHEEHP